MGRIATRLLSQKKRANGVVYTPSVVARKMARSLAVRRPAMVVDPACGRGDLLAAVLDEMGPRGILFVGVDRDAEALRRCALALRTRDAEVVTFCGDYFDINLRQLDTSGRNVYVTMNPPFVGYGSMPKRQRKHIRESVPGLKGRFNLAHAFLSRTIKTLHPKTVAALLPGNWPQSSYNELGHILLTRGNSWRRLPESTFDGVTTTAGLLVITSIMNPGKLRLHHGVALYKGSTIRQGVATGADDVYLRLAADPPSAGQVVRAARGRDVARGLRIHDLPLIWVPPSDGATASSALPGTITDFDRETLERRYCVEESSGPFWRYHEAVPEWFLGEPKLILPEVCTKVSVLFDADGEVLPLHSTIAIHVSGPTEAERLRGHLQSDEAWRFLRRRSPTMVSGARRMTTPVLRRLLRNLG